LTKRDNAFSFGRSDINQPRGKEWKIDTRREERRARTTRRCVERGGVKLVHSFEWTRKRTRVMGKEKEKQSVVKKKFVEGGVSVKPTIRGGNSLKSLHFRGARRVEKFSPEEERQGAHLARHEE